MIHIDATKSTGSRKKRIIWILMGLLIILALVSCMAGPNMMKGAEGPDGEPAGFWLGLWHGLIAFISFIVSLFNKNQDMRIRSGRKKPCFLPYH